MTDPLLLAALQEVDAMLPDSPPVAPVVVAPASAGPAACPRRLPPGVARIDELTQVATLLDGRVVPLERYRWERR